MSSDEPVAPTIVRALAGAEMVYLGLPAPLCCVCELRHAEAALTEESVAAALKAVYDARPQLRIALAPALASFVESSLETIPLSTSSLSSADLADAIRKELDVGTDREKLLLRAHLFLPPDTTPRLMLIADHVILDGRGMFMLLHLVLRALSGEEIESSDTSVPPDVLSLVEKMPELPSFIPPPDFLRTRPDMAPSEDPPALVVDRVIRIPEEIVSKLLVGCRERGTTLYGVMHAAWAAAIVHLQKPAMPATMHASVAACYRSLCGIESCGLGNLAGTFNVAMPLEQEASLWKVAVEAKEAAVAKIEAQEHLRVPATMAAGDFAALGPLFDVSYIFSNIGRYPLPNDLPWALYDVEFHISGPAASPLLTVHPVSSGHTAVCTVSYGPQFYSDELMDRLVATYVEIMTSAAEGDHLIRGTGAEDVWKLSELETFPKGRLPTRAEALEDVPVIDLSLLGTYTKLATVVCPGKALSCLDGLAQLGNLVRLELSNNDLTLFPKVDLPFLTKLDLSQNHLTDMDFVSSLPLLTHLDVSCNKITTVVECPGLTHFSARENCLQDISAISTALGLQQADFGTNQIVDVSGLASCRTLCALILRNNDITSLDLASPPLLQTLDVSGNPLTVQSLSSVSQSPLRTVHVPPEVLPRGLYYMQTVNTVNGNEVTEADVVRVVEDVDGVMFGSTDIDFRGDDHGEQE